MELLNKIKSVKGKSQGLKTWEEIKSLDDCILEEDRKILDSLKEQGKLKDTCPHLKREGEYFYFCGKNMSEEDLKDNNISPTNRKYHAHASTAEIQINCIKNYRSCCVYKGILKK